MTDHPIPLTTPASEHPISDLGVSYAKKSSAINQAEAWNEHLKDDPVYGPRSGFVVGIGPRTAGRYPLVWVGP